jgi:hypothetical protein
MWISGYRKSLSGRSAIEPGGAGWQAQTYFPRLRLFSLIAPRAADPQKSTSDALRLPLIPIVYLVGRTMRSSPNHSHRLRDRSRAWRSISLSGGKRVPRDIAGGLLFWHRFSRGHGEMGKPPARWRHGGLLLCPSADGHPPGLRFPQETNRRAKFLGSPTKSSPWHWRAGPTRPFRAPRETGAEKEKKQMIEQIKQTNRGQFNVEGSLQVRTGERRRAQRESLWFRGQRC